MSLTKEVQPYSNPSSRTGPDITLVQAMEEIDRLRNTMWEAASQIRCCDYTLARSTLLVALDHVV